MSRASSNAKYLLPLLLLATPAAAQSYGCNGVNCPNSVGNQIIPPKPRPDVIDVTMTRDNDATRRHDYPQAYGGGRSRPH